MTEKSIERLQFLCNTITQLLTASSEQAFSLKPNPAKWRMIEESQNLID